MEGAGAYTVVDGHKMTLGANDFVLTPNGRWEGVVSVTITMPIAGVGMMTEEGALGPLLRRRLAIRLEYAP